jgi:O-antigen biosynthesis protein WbqP
MYRRFLKRFIDTFCSVVILITLSPVLLLVAIAIFLQDRGPVFFVHKRIGVNGIPFNFFKFRSMPVNTPVVESKDIQQIKVTPFGKFIRRTSIDELPQLFNILSGDMSLVGPRPSLPSQHRLMELRRKNGSLALKPGLTGWAQVNSYDFMPEEIKAEFDGIYAKRISLLQDAKIVLRTLTYLTRKPPIY